MWLVSRLNPKPTGVRTGGRIRDDVEIKTWRHSVMAQPEPSSTHTPGHIEIATLT